MILRDFQWCITLYFNLSVKCVVLLVKRKWRPRGELKLEQLMYFTRWLFFNII